MVPSGFIAKEPSAPATGFDEAWPVSVVDGTDRTPSMPATSAGALRPVELAVAVALRRSKRSPAKPPPPSARTR
jgi:hypothetical protein